MNRLVLAAALMVSLWSAAAQAQCRQALALGMDVSGSVDAGEYRLQLEGLAEALLHPDVQDALLVMPATPVTLAVFDWSGPTDQRVILDWTVVDSAATLRSLSEKIRQTPRREGEPSTAIGEAMRFGLGLLSRQKSCWKRTLDISGDGVNNSGRPPQAQRVLAEAQAITINGLIIGAGDQRGDDQRQAEVMELWAFYRNRVVAGADPFVEVALGFADFEAAMVRKLKRELQGQLFSSLLPPLPRHQ